MQVTSHSCGRGLSIVYNSLRKFKKRKYTSSEFHSADNMRICRSCPNVAKLLDHKGVKEASGGPKSLPVSMIVSSWTHRKQRIRFGVAVAPLFGNEREQLRPGALAE